MNKAVTMLKCPTFAVRLWITTSLFSSEDGVGLIPKRGCVLTLAYYAFRRRYEFGERRWNDILTGENRRTRRKICPSATLSTTNPTWIDLGANPVFRGDRPATNDLSHGTAHYVSLSLTNRKSSVHLRALYSPRTALRTFTLCGDQLVICGQYSDLYLEAVPRVFVYGSLVVA
jgi:hypothetical protein